MAKKLTKERIYRAIKWREGGTADYKIAKMLGVSREVATDLMAAAAIAAFEEDGRQAWQGLDYVSNRSSHKIIKELFPALTARLPDGKRIAELIEIKKTNALQAKEWNKWQKI